MIGQASAKPIVAFDDTRVPEAARPVGIGLTRREGNRHEWKALSEPLLQADTDSHTLVDTGSNEEVIDVGTDILGASDSILGGSDTYTWDNQRTLSSTFIDNGTTASPYSIGASFWDQATENDTGSSTLTTTGHVYATDVITYVENTGASGCDSQNPSPTGQNGPCSGSAYDDYVNQNTITQTISDSVTTSVDSFTVSDTHYISGSLSYTSVTGPLVITAVDTQWDSASFSAEGTMSSLGENRSFVSIESMYGSDVATGNYPGSYNITATSTAYQSDMSYGSEWIAGTSQSYSWNETTAEGNSLTYSGATTTYTRAERTANPRRSSRRSQAGGGKARRMAMWTQAHH